MAIERLELLATGTPMKLQRVIKQCHNADNKPYHTVTIRVALTGTGGSIRITSKDGANCPGIAMSAERLSDCGLLGFAKSADEMYFGTYVPAGRSIWTSVNDMLNEVHTLLSK